MPKRTHLHHESGSTAHDLDPELVIRALGQEDAQRVNDTEDAPSKTAPALDYSQIAHLIRQESEKQSEIERLDMPESQQLAWKHQLRSVAKIIKLAEEMRHELAIHAVLEGGLSRVQVADALGLHQGTIAKWLKQA